MVDASDFIGGIYICIYPLHMPIKYMAYICNSGAFLFLGTYMSITCEVDIALRCVFAYICKIVVFICPFSISVV